MGKNQIPFDEFWELYPKKVGKKDSRKLWEKLTPLQQGLAIADIPMRANDRKWKEGFIKDPKTYINSEQWEDEINPGKTKLKDTIILK